MAGRWGKQNRSKPTQILGLQQGNNNTQVNNFFLEVVIPILTLTIPGIFLCAFGTILAFTSFAGWASIIFRIMVSHGNIAIPGPSLPTRIPLAACYFISFAGGGLIVGIGRSMLSSSGKKERLAASIRHAMIAVAVIFCTTYGVNQVAGGTPYRDLLPHFASCPWETADANLPLDQRINHPPAFRANLSMDEWTCKKTPTTRS
jgi:hypothetical protein